MLKSWRRYYALAALLLLGAPLVVGLVWPDSPAAVLKEGRRLAPPPAKPGSGADWLALPTALDAYLRDHFGLRQALIQAHKELTKPMLGMGDDAVLVGRDGRMFYLHEDAVRQSAGLVLRDQRVADTIALIKQVKDELRSRGVGFIVAPPPNAATVYQDDLPGWAQNGGKRTEYDMLLEGLAADGINAVDLRPVMKMASAEGPAYYRHDSHWTARGALAAYNAIVEADGRPNWRIDPGAALTPLSERKGGDLARLLGVQDSVTEEVEELALPAGSRELMTTDPYGDYVQTRGERGPTIMILGDSFTAGYFPQLLLQHAGRMIWIFDRHCGFDWKVIDKLRPDEVWWMPNERALICGPGTRPLDFAG